MPRTIRDTDSKPTYGIYTNLLPSELQEMGISDPVPPSKWLDEMMKSKKMTNADLARKLQEHGLTKMHRAEVGHWRKGDFEIPLHVLPFVCDALGCSDAETQRITAAALGDAFPRVANLIKLPFEEAKRRYLDNMAKRQQDRDAEKRDELRKMVSEVEVLISKIKEMI